MSYEQYKPSGFKLLPEVVKNLLIINGIFYLATYVLETSFGVDLVRLLGLHYFESEYFEPYQFVTHLFMHGGLGHIILNMFALWMFGNVLENVWGGKRFLIYYLVTGLGAAIIHTLVIAWNMHGIQNEAMAVINSASPEAFALFIKDNIPVELLSTDYRLPLVALRDNWLSDPGNAGYAQQASAMMNEYIQFKMNIPTVGASGAVFGVLLAFGMLFPNTVIYLYFAIPIKAKYFVILYGAIELYSGLQANPTDNVAHFAHLGGMLFGYFLIKYWNKRNRNSFY